MAFENELKYVLDLDACLEQEASKYGNLYQIEQRYVTDSKLTIRLRKSYSVKKETTKRYFTFKKIVCDQLVEFEKSIKDNEEDSFNLLWNEIGSCIVRKNRYKYTCANKEEWVIDFLKDEHDKIYFVQAEVEMEENQKKPLIIPTLVADNIIYEVEKTDKRFSNKKLSDETYAKQLYQSLLK